MVLAILLGAWVGPCADLPVWPIAAPREGGLTALAAAAPLPYTDVMNDATKQRRPAPLAEFTAALLTLDDASLTAMGLTRDELRRRPSQRSII